MLTNFSPGELIKRYGRVPFLPGPPLPPLIVSSFYFKFIFDQTYLQQFEYSSSLKKKKKMNGPNFTSIIFLMHFLSLIQLAIKHYLPHPGVYLLFFYTTKPGRYLIPYSLALEDFVVALWKCQSNWQSISILSPCPLPLVNNRSGTIHPLVNFQFLLKNCWPPLFSIYSMCILLYICDDLFFN